MVAIPRHPLWIESESVAWIDLGFRFLEPWVYPMGPEFTFVKAFEWEVREFPATPSGSSRRRALRRAQVARQRRVRALVGRRGIRGDAVSRKRREREVYRALTDGRGDEVLGLERIEAPAGTHVIDYVTDSWLARQPRPLVGRGGRLEV